MDARHDTLYPTWIERRLALDAVLMWLVMRVVAFALGAVGQTASLVPSSRTSALVVLLASLLCYIQIRMFRETNLLRNLGIGLARQIAVSVLVAGTLEIVSRWLLGALFDRGAG